MYKSPLSCKEAKTLHKEVSDKVEYRGGAPQGGQGGGHPPNLSIGGGIAPTTLGYNTCTKGCQRVHYCLYSVTVYTG